MHHWTYLPRNPTSRSRHGSSGVTSREVYQRPENDQQESVAVLEPGSEVLAAVQQQFHSRLRLRKDSIKLSCFFEELPMPAVGKIRAVVYHLTVSYFLVRTRKLCLNINVIDETQIVPEHSAVLAGYHFESIYGDHQVRTLTQYIIPQLNSRRTWPNSQIRRTMGMRRCQESWPDGQRLYGPRRTIRA